MFEKGLILKAETFSDRLFNRSRVLWRTLARACLIASFFEDSFRLVTQWPIQVREIGLKWTFGPSISCVVIVMLLFCELAGCVMILLQQKTSYGCLMLVFVILFHTLTFNGFDEFHPVYIVNNLSLVGAVMMIFADSQSPARPSPAELPALEDDKPKSLMQLSGRCLLMFMFFTLLELGTEVHQIVHDVVGSVLMAFVVFGYKTKLSAFLLMVFFTLANFYENSWWIEPDTVPHHKRDYIKYDFLHSLSVVGGLLMVVLHGPGDLSVDARKKQW